VLAIIFSAISLLHVKWAIFGLGNVNNVYPEFPGRGGPKAYQTAIVAIGLFLMAMFYFWKSQIFSFPMSEFLAKYLGWIITGIFLLRAIGDFNYVGLFSENKGTAFDNMDRKYYSPLCLFIGVAALIIEIMS